ncbi:MAG: alpha/beta fold hydrolase [Candidatus Thorarchaeota archaeon]
MKKTGKLSLERLVSLPVQKMARSSPDGKKIAFVSNTSGQDEIHVIDLETKEIIQLTKGEYSASSVYWYNWTADGKSLIYSRDPAQGKEKYDLYKISYPKGVGQQLTDSPENQDFEGKQSPDGTTIAFISDRAGMFQIFAMNEDGSDIRQVTKEGGIVLPEWTLGLAGHYWSPDGKYIVYTKTAADNFQCYDVWSVQYDGTDERNIISLGEGSQEIVNHMSKDGSMILFTSDSTGTKQVGIYYRESEKIKWISTTNYPEEGVCFSDDGKEIIVIRHFDAQQKIVLYDVATQKDTMLDLPPGIASSAHTVRNGRYLPIEHEDSVNRTRHLLYNLDNHSYEEIIPAQYQEYSPEEFHPDEYVSYPSTDGVTIHAILYRPMDIQSGEKLPVVVIPHGGPTLHYSRGFYNTVQVLVDRGYVCLLPNVRGSTGYGTEFRDACLHDWGGRDLEDIVNGVRYLKSLDYIDETRIGIYGASYGGYLTYMAMTKKPELWKVGVAVNGFTHLKEFYDDSKTIFPAFAVFLEGQMGKPDENLSLWEDRSPANFAENVVGKLQIIHAVNDPRCPLKQAEIFRDRLIEHGRKEGEDFEFKLLEDRGHFADATAQKLEYYQYLLEFLEKNL